jgi:hypothetical protein
VLTIVAWTVRFVLDAFCALLLLSTWKHRRDLGSSASRRKDAIAGFAILGAEAFACFMFWW